MSNRPLSVFVVVGSLNKNSITRVVLNIIAEALRARHCHVDVLDFLHEPLSLFNPEESPHAAGFPTLQKRVDRADVFVLGTPDYHGSMSSAMKNFLDHFWREFGGKLFAPIVASHEKGLTVIDQLRTVARQCYAWSMPYGMSFIERDDVKDGRIASEPFQRRLDMFVRDVVVYGDILARQRSLDLAGNEQGFMARWRKS